MYNLYTRRTKERSHLKREEINFLIAKSKLHQTDKPKYSNVILQETLLLSKNQNQASARERTKRMRRNEEEEAYL